MRDDDDDDETNETELFSCNVLAGATESFELKLGISSEIHLKQLIAVLSTSPHYPPLASSQLCINLLIR